MSESLAPAIPRTGKYKGSVLHALEGKNVFVTGATGFLGKVLVEKILRSVPNVHAVYLLVRPRKGQSAQERMEKEVLSSEVFTRLRKERPDFDEFARRKLVAIPGELTQRKIGLSDAHLKFLTETLDVIIHCAAVVDFNERIDRAVELNVLGSLRMLDLARACAHLGAYVHVSTAYVNSNRTGWVDEKLYPLGFDPEAMIKKIRNMNEAELEKVTVTGMVGDWPNTYTFTKAMAEHLLVAKRGRVPLVILRPSIVGASWKEPVPGWVDCLTAAGAVYMAVGLGVVKFLPGDPTTKADIIPVDYVINAILTSIPTIMHEDRWYVAHACSSSERPMTWGVPRDVTVKYFQEHPPARAIGKPGFFFTRTPQEYQMQFFLRYSVPSSILSTIASLGFKSQKEKAAQLDKLVFRVRVIIEAFRHFIENEWIFDNKHVRAGYQMLNEEERKLFPLNLSELDWTQYNSTFAYGLLRFVMKDDLIDQTEVQPLLYLHDEPWKPEDEGLVGTLRRTFKDVTWAFDKTRNYKEQKYPEPRSPMAMRAAVLGAPAVQAAIRAAAKSSSKDALDAAEAKARNIIEVMQGDTTIPVLSGLGWFFRKIWRRLYKGIQIDQSSVERVQAVAKKAPIIYLPTHRSYIDFLILSYACFHLGLPVPHIAAGEDFLGIMLVRWLFRKSGAFFLRRTFLGGDALYEAIFREYVQRTVLDGQALEFFVEGTRSRSGKMLHPKLGLLSIVTDLVLDKKLPDLTIVPVTINYEKTIEGNLYSNELLGDSKIKESLKSLLRSSSILKMNFGTISLRFGEPMSVKDFTQQHVEQVRALPEVPRRLTYTADPATTQGPGSFVFLPPAAYASPDAPGAEAKRPADAEAPLAAPAPHEYDPESVRGHRHYLNRRLAYRVVGELARESECMATHLVATLILMFRQGITKSQLIRKTAWLRDEVALRGGRMTGMEREYRTHVIDRAISYLEPAVIQGRQNVYEPNINARSEYKNMLVLGQYRNKIVHLFFREGLFACALYSLGEDSRDQGADKAALMREVRLLHSLLHREFIYKDNPDELEDFEVVLAQTVERGIFKVSESRVEVAPTGEAHFSFLCALFWPFIDSYYAASLILFSLQPDREAEETLLVQKTQALATTLYHESMLCFYESCSLETLRNAFHVLQDWGVISRVKRTAGQRTEVMIRLLPPFQEERPLTELVETIGRLRKSPPVRRSSLRRNLIADIPLLAKL